MIRGFGPKKTKTQRKAPRTKIPFQRVSAQIQIDSSKTIAESRVFLNDLSPTGVGCFVTIPIDKGEQVSLVITQPRHLFVKAEIIWCTPYTLTTKVLTQDSYKYRIGLKFLFDSAEDRDAVKKFCEEIYANLNKP